MNRRDFLTLLSGGSVALAVLPVSDALAALTSNRWEWIKATGFKPSPYEHVLIGQVMGRRSDGNYYYTMARLDPAAASDPIAIKQTEENMRMTLDTFLHCECREGFQCDVHQQMFGYFQDASLSSECVEGSTAEDVCLSGAGRDVDG